jgi:hypothetical protein
MTKIVTIAPRNTFEPSWFEDLFLAMLLANNLGTFMVTLGIPQPKSIPWLRQNVPITLECVMDFGLRHGRAAAA